VRQQFLELAKKEIDVFGLDNRLGSHPEKLRIRIKEGERPRAVPMYHASPAKREVIDKQIDVWFQQGVIEESKSPWAAPVVIAYRNDKPRFCVDYRKLNEVTSPDEHPLP